MGQGAGRRAAAAGWIASPLSLFLSSHTEAPVLAKRLTFSALVIFAAVYLAACGGSSKSGRGGSTNPAITIGSTTLPTG
jgi:hypothetical protein